MLLGRQGNLKVGYKFSLLGWSVLHKLNAIEFAGVVCFVLSELKCFVEPLQTTHQLRQEGEAYAMKAGDLNWACMLRGKCAYLIWGGTNLTHVIEAISAAIRFISEHQHNTSMFFLLPHKRMVLTLMGKDVDVLSDDEISNIVNANNNPRHAFALSFHKLYMALLSEGGVSIVKELEAFLDHEQSSSSPYSIVYIDAIRMFYSGLASYQAFRETKAVIWMQRGRSRKDKIKHFNDDGCPWNFEHKFFLLEAEEHFCDANFKMAHECYQKAIISARAHKFINEEALACEFAAKFYLHTGDLAMSLEHFTLAHEKYHEWGALGKADLLFRYIKEKFPGSFVGSSQQSSPTTRFVSTLKTADGSLKRSR